MRNSTPISHSATTQSDHQENSLTEFLRWTTIALFHALVLIVPFFFTWVNEELFEFNKMLLVYGLTIFIVGTWAGRMFLEQRIIFKRTLFDWPIALFVTSQVLSTIFSIHPYTSLFGYYTRFHGGLFSTLAYVALFYAATSTFTKKTIAPLLLTTMIAACGVSLYAIPEHYGWSPSCWLISDGQFPPVGETGVSCWVQDVQNRVFATFGQPNWLAAYAIMLIPVAASLLLTKKNSLGHKVVYGSSIVLLFLTLIFTKSRSGFLGLGLGMVLWTIGILWITLWPKFKARQKIDSWPLAVVGCVLVVLGGLAGWHGTPFFPALADSFSGSPVASNQPSPTPTPAPAMVNRLEVGGTDSGEIRKIVWEGALKVWQRYPILGSGVETFAYSYYQDRPLAHNLVSEWDFLYNKAHNEWLNLLATTGIFGLGTYLLLLGWYGWYSSRPTVIAAFLGEQNDDETRLSLENQYLIIGMAAGAVALSVSNFLGFSTVMVTVLLFLYLAFLDILSTPAAQELKPVQLNKQPLNWLQITGLLACCGVGVYGLNTVVQIWYADLDYTMGKSYINAGAYTEGLNDLQQAILRRPHEALFHDELAATYAQLAVAVAQQGDATTSGQLAEAAVATSNNALTLNGRHLNFFKTRARIFITLAQLNEKVLIEAQRTLQEALKLAPSDPKLMYHLALVTTSMGQVAEGKQYLEKTIELKPNYEAARAELAKYYIEEGNYQSAAEQYRYILERINPENEGVRELLYNLEASISALPVEKSN